MNWVSQVQDEHRAWLRGRYDGQSDPREPLLGLVGEAGEAAQALLDGVKKGRYGPNPRRPDPEASLLDAVGDMAIYCVSWCNTVGLDARSFTWDGAPERHYLPPDPLDAGCALVKAACICFEAGRVTQFMVDLLREAAGGKLGDVVAGAWAQVKARAK